MGVDIFGVQGSPPCRAVYLVAKAIGLDYNYHKVDMQAGQHRSPEFLQMNPAHTVPTMKDGQLCLGERCVGHPQVWQHRSPELPPNL